MGVPLGKHRLPAAFMAHSSALLCLVSFALSISVVPS